MTRTLLLLALVCLLAPASASAQGPRSRQVPPGSCPAWRPCGPGNEWGGNRAFPQVMYGVDGRPMCARHDACYDNPGARRIDCDRAFLAELHAACEFSTNPRACHRKARQVYIAVRLIGGVVRNR